MVFFKDFGKSVSDMFKADKYAFNRTFNVKVKSEQSDFETKHVLDKAGTMKSKMTYVQRDSALGKFEVVIPSKGDLELDYQAPEMMKGVTSNLVVTNPRVELKNKICQGRMQAKLDATMDTSSMNVNNVYVEGAANFDGVSLGGAVSLQPGSQNMLADYNLGLQYEQSKDTTLSVKTASRCDKINVMVGHQYSGDTFMAARYVLDMENPSSPVFDIGTKHKVDGKGTVQMAMRSDMSTMMMYKHMLNDRLAVSLGTTFNMNKMTADSTNVHYKVEFEA